MREPFTAVRFLAERLPLEKLYKLSLPEGETQWTPLLICEQLAERQGIYIARAGRPDGHAAGRSILYEATDGVVPFAIEPPDEEAICAIEVWRSTSAASARASIPEL